MAILFFVFSGSILWFQTVLAWAEPHLEEAARVLGVVIHFGVLNTRPCRQVLHTAARQRLLVTHTVCMRQPAVDNVGKDFGVAVRMRAKARVGLH